MVATASKPAKQTPVEGLEAGDEVYCRHPTMGATMLKVLAVGKHGFQGVGEDGLTHRVHHSEYLGHKARALHTYSVKDEGADGVLVERQDGQRRFLRGELPKPSEDSGDGTSTGKKLDPLLSSLDELVTKAIRPLAPGPDWIMKAAGARALFDPQKHPRGQPKNKGQFGRGGGGGGSAPKPGKARPKAETDPPHEHEHGDKVRFQHGGVRGQGEIVASGKDGVTVRTEDGREHLVRHDALLPPNADDKQERLQRREGEDDKAYSKRVVDKRDHPGKLKEDHGQYFEGDGQEVPVADLVPTKGSDETKDSGQNASKRLHAASQGEISKRGPVTVRKRPDGKYDVLDGNSTVAAAKEHGWKTLPVQMEGEGEGAEPGPLFDEAEVASLPASASQPVSQPKQLFAKATEAQEALKEWLDKGKGVASKIGAELQSGSPESVNLDQPGSMLFIAPVKSEKRATEKVAADYGGDWSKLLDPVRCSFACDTFADIKTTLDALQASGMKLARKPKDRFDKPTDVGYRDCLLNVVLPNGIVGEVQLHSKAMLKAKADGHKWYEIQRDLEGKPDLSDEDSRKLLASKEAQRQIYGEAWQVALKGKETMGKALDVSGTPYTYFEHDNAYFRRLNRDDRSSIDDVLHGDKWVPYTGDRLKPAYFGDEVPDPLGGKKEAP